MKEISKIKKYLIIVLLSILLIGVFNVIIDPYFHYHKPLKGLAYPIEYERYQNDGILKNFDYDAIITGSSMCENFNTSELDKLFNVSSVKVPESGGSYKEINDLLKTALANKDSIKIVVRGLDTSRFFDNKNAIRYEESWYPTYLYDSNVFNDVNYLLNKGTLCSSISVLLNTLMGNTTTTFDEYANWMKDYQIGKEYVKYNRSKSKKSIGSLTEEERKNIIDNIKENVVDIAEANKNTEFYLFFTPYSICYFDNLNNTGNLQRQLQAEKIIIKELLKHDNIKIFSFFDDYDLICDLDNYRDITHYGEHINSYIIECMKEFRHLITNNNYEEYCENEEHFFTSFDYDAYFAASN